jgi:hypothetical protein
MDRLSSRGGIRDIVPEGGRVAEDGSDGGSRRLFAPLLQAPDYSGLDGLEFRVGDQSFFEHLFRAL